MITIILFDTHVGITLCGIAGWPLIIIVKYCLFSIMNTGSLIGERVNLKIIIILCLLNFIATMLVNFMKTLYS